MELGSFAINSTNSPTKTSIEDPYLWSNKPFSQKIVEIIYLCMIACVGTFGNLIVISSIVLEKRVHINGNAFVVNLAVADLMVTGFVIPTVILNVVSNSNGLTEAGCFTAGYVVTVTCTCSLCNLMFIAVNRYFAVVRRKTYITIFAKRKIYLMVLATWVWSNLLTFPTFLGWGSIAYDPKMELCSWNDTFSLSYTYFLATCAVILPLVVIVFCYIKVFTSVRSSGLWVRSLSVSSNANRTGVSGQSKRSLRREYNLLATLATTIAFFCVCWLPYGFSILIDAKNITALLKKVFGWLALTNSAINFVIYGIMNPSFRRGYINLFQILFCCKILKKSGTSLSTNSNSDNTFKPNLRKFSVEVASSKKTSGAHVYSNGTKKMCNELNENSNPTSSDDRRKPCYTTSNKQANQISPFKMRYFNSKACIAELNQSSRIFDCNVGTTENIKNDFMEKNCLDERLLQIKLIPYCNGEIRERSKSDAEKTRKEMFAMKRNTSLRNIGVDSDNRDERIITNA